MKKLSCCFAVLFLIFSSCNSSIEENQNVPVGFLKRINNSGMFGTVAYDYFYEGNKISKVVSKHGTKRYIYTGNLITEIRSFNKNLSLLQKKTFHYNANDELISASTLYYESNLGYRQELVYNPDGTVLVKHFQGNLTSQNDFAYSELNYIEDNEIIKTVATFSSGVLITTYEYDSGNNPMKYVTGYSKLNILGKFGDNMYFILPNGNQRNCIKIVEEGENIDCGIVGYSISHNSTNFPALYCSNELVTLCSDLPCYSFIYQ
jgi:hypothetical protein